MNHLRIGVNRLVVGRSIIPVTFHHHSPCTNNGARNLSSFLSKTQSLPVKSSWMSIQSSNNISYVYSSCSYSLFKSKNAEATPPPNNSKNTEGKDEGTKQENVAAESEIEAQLRAELSKAVSEVATYRAKAREFEEKYLLALADMENLRKRMTKQINDSKLYATQGFCKDLTEIEDILQLAINSVPKEEVNSNKYLKELYEGVLLTEARLLQVFKAHGLTQINPLNSKFNPNEHEAVIQVEDKEKESGIVVFVSKVGYKLHDRVIRPAVVGVSK